MGSQAAARRGGRRAIAILTGTVLPVIASAQSFTVTAEIVPGCGVVESMQTTGLDFGRLQFGTHPAAQSGPVDASAAGIGGGPVRLECTPGLELQLTVGAGEHASGTERRLGNGSGAFIPYSLFATPSYDTPLPAGGNVSLTVPSSVSSISPSMALPRCPVRPPARASIRTRCRSRRFQVTVTVTEACEVTSAPDVSFGQAPTVTQFPQVSQSLSVVCTKDLALYTVGLNAGQHAASGRRRMASGGQFLAYDVFKAGGGAVWGDADASRVANAAPGHGVLPEAFAYVVQIYTDQSTPPVGVYIDVIIIDLDF